MVKFLIYPDDAQRLLKQYQIEEKDRCAAESPNDNEAPFSNVFFEFANTGQVGYRAPGKELLVFEQDESACEKHTGGIIWETAYVLLNYLLKQTPKQFLGKTIELGAGVGFLGQCLASEGCCDSMVVTETNDVLVHLERTVKTNEPLLNNKSITAQQLDWRNCDEDIPKLSIQSFDTMLATDVLFAPELVEPLLKTASRLSKETTVWYLCVQKRCSKSHEEFLALAPGFGFHIEDLSDDLDEWGKAVECVLLRLTINAKTISTGEPALKRTRVG